MPPCPRTRTTAPKPGAIAVGDIAVLASAGTNARVPPGGWSSAHFAFVRFTRVTFLDLRPAAAVGFCGTIAVEADTEPAKLDPADYRPLQSGRPDRL